jgi:glycosyltransferase involved in cell wall biosynthesis
VRLLIDTTYRLRAPFSGTAVYIERLCEALRRSCEVEVVEAANQRRGPPAGGGMGSLRNLMADRRWTRHELPRLAAEAGAELIHHPLPAYARTRVPQAITVHDLAFERWPDKFDPWFRRYAKHLHRRAASRAGVVICVSEATARDVAELWGVPAERIVVAPHGPGQELPPPQREHSADEHFLYVGDDEPRKNLGALLSAHQLYREAADDPLPLVLAGSLDHSQPSIRVERNPSPQQLAELYAGAVALVHPSLYEGFGLTALEAMSVGTPVIAASTPGLLEVCADAALYVDPTDPQALAVAMARTAADPELRRDLAQRGRRRAAGFSWSRSAQAHLRAYALALSGRRG